VPDGKTLAYTTTSPASTDRSAPAEAAPKDPEHFERGFFYARLVAKRRTPCVSDHDILVWMSEVAANLFKWNVIRTGDSRLLVVARRTLAGVQHRWSNQQSGIWLYNTNTQSLARSECGHDFHRIRSCGNTFFISTRHENPTFSRPSSISQH